MNEIIHHVSEIDSVINCEIEEIIIALSNKWFINFDLTDEEKLYVGELYYYRVDEKIRSFLIFKKKDNKMSINLIGTHPEHHCKGYGGQLMQKLESYACSMECSVLNILIPPPEYNPNYLSTINFLIKNGFTLYRRHEEMWDNGALELNKFLL